MANKASNDSDDARIWAKLFSLERNTDFRSLPRVLMRVVFGIYCSIAFCFTVVQVLLEVQNEKAKLQVQVSDLVEVFHPVLAEALWSFDDQVWKNTVDGMMKNHFVAGVVIQDAVQNKSTRNGIVADDNGKAIWSGEQQFQAKARIDNPFFALYSYTVPLQYNDYGKLHEVGIIHVYTGRDTVFSRVYYTVAVTIVNAIFKSFFLWLIIFLVLKKYVVQPLEALIKTVSEFDINSYDSDTLGDELTSHPAIKDNKTELTILALSISFMLKKIHEQNQSLHSYQLELEEKVEQRTVGLLEEKIISEQARLEAEKANKEKSEFLGRVSHELRTPLNAVIGFSKILCKRADAEKLGSLAEMPKTILRAGNHLLRLVNDILDVVITKEGKVIFRFAACNLDKLINESLKVCDESIANLNLSIKRENTDLNVTADPLRLQQVFTNLISNAAKYNQQNGEIFIYAKEIGNQIEVNIKDSGVGILVGDQNKIFDAFKRLEYAELKGIEGSGLGLSLTKNLVEAMHGTIDVESIEGEGSRFFFRLPKSDDEPVEEIVSDLDESALVSANCEYCLVLYVDNDEGSQELFRAVCDMHPNITLMLCSTAEEGLILAKEHKPSIVFMEVELPRMSGTEAVWLMKSMKGLVDTKFIALSSLVLPEDKEAALAAGFDLYMTKPFDPERIFNLVCIEENPK